MFMRGCGASITLLHVVKPEVSVADYGYGAVLRQTVDESLIKKARIRLNNIRKDCLAVAAHSAIDIRTGVPGSEIVRAATDLKIDLIVMGCSRVAASPQAPWAGVAQSVICLAPCPVLVVPNKTNGFLRAGAQSENEENQSE